MQQVLEVLNLLTPTIAEKHFFKILFCNFQYNSFMAKNWLLIQNRRKYGSDQIFLKQIETFKLFILSASITSCLQRIIVEVGRSFDLLTKLQLCLNVCICKHFVGRCFQTRTLTNIAILSINRWMSFVILHISCFFAHQC